MLISHVRRFVFVHIYKTGGTSITYALVPHAVGKLRRLAGVVLGRPASSDEVQPYFKHATASEIASKMGFDDFSSYFSFTFVRNPWDWQVSLYKEILRDHSNQHHAIVSRVGSFRDYYTGK